MTVHGVFFPTADFKQMIQSCGGEWNDAKQRPLVCLLKSGECDGLYWAIPMGDMAHRSEEQRNRIMSFINLPKRDIRSCYYHMGKTDKESLFFISDAVPITEKYVDRAYLVNGVPYEIKNEDFLTTLKTKLFRVLSVENRNPNKFRQHITDVKLHLIQELTKQAN